MLEDAIRLRPRHVPPRRARVVPAQRRRPRARQRQAFGKLFPRLLEAFSEPRGGIITSYLCQHIPVAAVLTDIDRAASLTEGLPVHKPSSESSSEVPPSQKMTARQRAQEARARRAEHRRAMAAASSSAIHLEPLQGQPADWKAKELLFRCMDLHYRALQYLNPKPRKICMRMIFGIVVALLGTLDVPPSQGRQRPFSTNLTAVESLEAELEQSRRYYDRSAQRQAQVEYFKGMIGGLVFLLAGLIVLGLIAGAPLLHEPLLATPLAGGAGAIVSVMTRMTRDQLSLNYESGVTTIRLLGVIRPLLGALFGGALYLMLAGGLITVAQTPTDETDLIYFYTAIAFVAGFTERWAQDVVTGRAGGPRGHHRDLGPARLASEPHTARPRSQLTAADASARARRRGEREGVRRHDRSAAGVRRDTEQAQRAARLRARARGRQPPQAVPQRDAHVPRHRTPRGRAGLDRAGADPALPLVGLPRLSRHAVHATSCTRSTGRRRRPTCATGRG